jgi:hypothetical protein
VATSTWCKALPLALAAALFLGGCDDEEEKKPEVEVHVPKGVELKVKRIDEDESEMIIVGELALFTLVTIWALFGPGATRHRDEALLENG